VSPVDELELEDVEPLPAPAYVGEVLVGGVPVDLDRVLASVTIRHGRDDVDGPIQSSTATLRLRNLDRSELPTYVAGGELVVKDVAGGLLFTGEISDANLTHDDPQAEAILEVIAVSTLASSGDRPVRGHAWPAEPWAARVQRILDEAGLVGVVQAPALDVPLAATKPDDPETGAYASSSALDALDLVRQDVGATAFDAPDGSLVVQAFDARKGLFDPLPIAPELVLFSPAWSQTLDVANRVVLGYGYGDGSVTVDEPVSQDRFGVHWTGLFETGLADAATAQSRAALWLDRVAWPRWKLPGVTLLEPHPLAIGQLVQLSGLPASAPFEAWGAVVEGWADVIEGADWTQEVVLSDPIFSGMALAWAELPADLTWLEVDPACPWREAYLLDNLVPALLGDVPRPRPTNPYLRGAPPDARIDA
jgi:hypothetical protein